MANAFYDWAQIGITQINNLYLYGSLHKPTNIDLNRPQGVGVTIEIDAATFMSSGPGRFANGTQSDFVIDFMSGNFMPSNGTRQEFTFSDSADSRRFFGLQQYNYADDAGLDSASRTWIYNSSGFAIAADARFIVEADGTRHIENFAILPQPDNFDFEGGGLANLINPVVQPIFDPLGIGRKVDIVFEEATQNMIPRIDYGQAQFALDQEKQAEIYHPISNVFLTGSEAWLGLPDFFTDVLLNTIQNSSLALKEIMASLSYDTPTVTIIGNWSITDYGNGVSHKEYVGTDGGFTVRPYDEVWSIGENIGIKLVLELSSANIDSPRTLTEYTNGALTKTTYLSINPDTAIERVITFGSNGIESGYSQFTAYNKTLTDIAWERKVSLTELEALNPHITDPNATLNGESVVISLDPTNTGTGVIIPSILISTTTSATPTSSGATHEGQAAADVAGGYAVATGTHSVGFADNTLNSSAYFDVVRGALATGDIRAGNFNPSANTIVGLDGNITPFSNLLGSGAGSTPINQYGVPTGEFNGQLTYAPNFAVNNNVASIQQNNFTYVDPLILDLNGDGVQLTSFAEHTVLFDIDHDAAGSKEQTGWVKADTTLATNPNNTPLPQGGGGSDSYGWHPRPRPQQQRQDRRHS